MTALNIINIISVNNIAVLGLLNKLNNGPVIININPNVDEIKKRGNLIKFSQKVGII